jgi:transposase
VLFKGALTGPSPVDGGRTGSKHHLICDKGGIPLAATLTGGNRNDVTQLLPLIDGVGPVRGKIGRPRQRAEQLIADRGYDHDKYRRELWKRGVKPVIARRNTEHGSGLGKLRWSSSERSRGCTSSVACACAGSAGPSCTRPSCTSAVRSSASATSAPLDRMPRRSRMAQDVEDLAVGLTDEEPSDTPRFVRQRMHNLIAQTLSCRVRGIYVIDLD